MFWRDALTIQSEMEEGESQRLLAELLQADGYVIPPDVSLAKGLFSFEALNSIMLDDTANNLIERNKEKLKAFTDRHFGYSNKDIPVSVYKEQSISLVPLLHEITVRKKANYSKDLLAETKTYTETSASDAIYKAFTALETTRRKENNKDVKEYQLLKVSEQMYLKTFTKEKRKLAMAIMKTMAPMEEIIPHLYSLGDE